MRLRQGEASLGLRILLPEEPVWALCDTAAPKNEWDSPNPGTVMVGFEAIAPASGVLDLAVVLTPGSRQPAAEVTLAPPMAWGK